MKLCFFTDPHLGVVRSTHTTVRSQEALRAHLYDMCQGIAERAQEEHATLICLGDLFDKHSNKEPIVNQGIDVAATCSYVVAGNHDMVNRRGEIGSLQLVKNAIEALSNDEGPYTQIIIAPDADPCFKTYLLDTTGATLTWLVFVPHAYSQELFEISVKQACEFVKQNSDKESYFILCLHCNVGDLHGNVEDEGTALALTADLQKLVTKHFDKVLVGHEHERREVGSSILILGNIFPLGFGEISDRFITWFDTVTQEWGSERIFEAKPAYHEIDANVLVEMDGEFIDPAAQLIRVTGTVRVDEFPKVARALQQLWKANEDTLFAVANFVEIERPKKAKIERNGGTRTLRSVVSEAITQTAFKDEYEEIAAEEDED